MSVISIDLFPPVIPTDRRERRNLLQSMEISPFRFATVEMTDLVYRSSRNDDRMSLQKYEKKICRTSKFGIKIQSMKKRLSILTEYHIAVFRINFNDALLALAVSASGSYLFLYEELLESDVAERRL